MNATLLFSTTLGISILGLLAILIIKRFEIRTGRKFFGRARQPLDSASVFIVEGVPSLFHQGRHHALGTMRQWLQFGVMHAIVQVEKTLEKMLHNVREKTRTPREPGEASQFLREVADHKREILNRAPQERIILED